MYISDGWVQVVYCTSTYSTYVTPQDAGDPNHIGTCQVVYTLSTSYENPPRRLNRNLATDKTTTLFSFLLLLLPSHVLRLYVTCGVMTDLRATI